MKIDTYFTPPEVDSGATVDATVVVIDVVRATTTLIEALANGARAIYPADSTEEAVRLASSMGREDTLLCGERKGVKVEGFDLGNSPWEFDAATVKDKKIVMSTTNGSRALGAAADGAKLLPCAFTNLSSVAEAISGDDHVVIVCAGREDRFSLDDALCAGHLIQRTISDSEEEHELNDAARAVLALASARQATKRFLSLTAAGASIIEIGLDADLDICADVDRHDFVVEMKDRAITRAGE
ncbi:MAG: 2-phosphosulfolactate phosphatase [Gemmatimonadetes bacterium]|nr:2-phosphosulfolactate phosphatase [Gemmatimonadota bacterium]NNF12508.1 2-phosphosulfolactate phosphatase [Gemmatimonadota bacterium]NNL30294.1 2-phosphosulfolactate phosphatase [Gemmatimonadota bacterium]